MRASRPTGAAALAVALGLTVLAGACGGDSDADSDAGGTAPAAMSTGDPKTLTIKDFAVGPQPLVVPEGTVVTVTNEDDAAHTATAEDNSFDTGSLGRGDSKDITLSEEGEIDFVCSIHDYMNGVIRVTA